MVNGFDDESEPNSYVYVSKNCQTKPMPIDRNIEKLKVFHLDKLATILNAFLYVAFEERT